MFPVPGLSKTVIEELKVFRISCFTGWFVASERFLSMVFLYGDVKPDNVLVYASHFSPFCCVAKIADFGVSVQDLDNGVVKVQDRPRGTE